MCRGGARGIVPRHPAVSRCIENSVRTPRVQSEKGMSMTHATRIGRLAGLAVGLGIGAALAATAGVASADDLQISIDGYDLLPVAGNTAIANSDMGDIAIAFGNGANATAIDGNGDFAFADGAGSTADVGSYGASNLSAAIANGTGSLADAGYGNFDYASASGDLSKAEAGYGNFDVALANGYDSLAGASGGVLNNTTLLSGNDDFASAWGPNTIASAGDLFNPSTPSSDDAALVFDPFGTAGSDAYAGIGNFDLGAVFGDMLTANAFGGNYLLDILPSL